MTAWGQAVGNWRRFGREGCPGCALVGSERSHELCTRREQEHGTLLKCHRLGDGSAPGWEYVGPDKAHGGSVWFIAHGASELRDARPREREHRPTAPRLGADALREFLAELLEVSEQLATARAREVAEFYKSRSVPLDRALYRVGPSTLEARRIVDTIEARGVLRRFAGFALPGIVEGGGKRPTLSVSRSGEAWELVLDAGGACVGVSRRMLHPERESGGAKARSLRNTTPAAHFTPNVRDARTLLVTEGARKANEVARRLGVGAVGLPGVNAPRALREVESVLREHRPSEVWIAADFADLVDGDKRHDSLRRAVREHWGELVRVAADVGAIVRALAWNPTLGKGLDDVLAGLACERGELPAEVRVLGWSEYVAAFRWGDGSLAAPASDAQTSPFEASRTRELVRNGEDAARVSREVLESWPIGSESLHVEGFAGLGKTRAAGDLLLDGLYGRAARVENGIVHVDMRGHMPGFEDGVAVLALPTRELVIEKAEALRRRAKQRVGEGHVREWLGRSKDPDSGWYCEQLARARYRAELGQVACVGCALREQCKEEDGRFLKSRGQIASRIRAATQGRADARYRLLLVATFDALRAGIDELPTGAPIVLDDIEPLTLGVVRDVELRIVDVESALEHVENWLAGCSIPQIVPGRELPEVIVAGLVRDLLEALARRGTGEARRKRIVRAVEAWGEVERAAVLAGEVKAHEWSWDVPHSKDDGADLRPAFTRLALDVARAVLEGRAPTIERRRAARGEPELLVRIRDAALIERMRAGRVAVLGVAPVPEVVAASLNMRREVIHAKPDGLRVVVAEHRIEAQDGLGERVLAFGPGNRKHGATSAEDRAVREFVRVVVESRASGEVGAVLHKSDREALGSPNWCVSYGDGHASTDKLAGCGVLLVRRFVPPYSALESAAKALRAALKLGPGG